MAGGNGNGGDGHDDEHLTIAQRFYRLFAGAERSHGTYDPDNTQQSDGGKVGIRRSAVTLREPVTVRLWEQHLAGHRPLGIVPIREDGCCFWGAVDVDVYNTDIAELAGRLREMRIPAIVCRSKSGGAHVYIFFSEAVPASQVLPRLRELAAVIGHGESEIFPKQTEVLVERGDLGSWINMPYFGGDKTDRYAVRPDGRGMSLEAFLAAAEAVRLSARQLQDLVLAPRAEGFGDGPPCLETLAANKVPLGAQNNALLNFGILAKRKYPDSWEKVLEGYNATVLDPPGSSDGLQSVIRSLRKKDYQYQCRKPPMCNHCNVALCKTRPHGVGAGGEATVLESASFMETDPPIWFVVLKVGGTVEVTSRQLLNMHEFQVAAMDQIGRHVVPDYPRQSWTNTISKITEEATKIEVPKESGVKGEFEELLEQFLTDRYRAKSRDEILSGKPWLDEDNGRVYFRLQDLTRSMERVRFKTPSGTATRSWTTARLREMGGGTRQFTAAGVNTNVWWLMAEKFSWTAVRYDLPKHEESPL